MSKKAQVTKKNTLLDRYIKQIKKNGGKNIFGLPPKVIEATLRHCNKNNISTSLLSLSKKLMKLNIPGVTNAKKQLMLDLLSEKRRMKKRKNEISPQGFQILENLVLFNAKSEREKKELSSLIEKMSSQTKKKRSKKYAASKKFAQAA